MKKLIEYLKTHRKYRLKYITKHFLTQDVYNVLTKYNLTLHELCYRIKNNISLSKVFKCKLCNKNIVFNYKHGYQPFCNVKCQVQYFWNSKDTRQNRVQNSLKKYGVEHYSKTQEFKDRFKKTCLQHFGEITNLKTIENKEKSKQTCLNKYGTEYYTQTQESKDRIKQTSLNKYGVEHPSQSKIVKDKITKTILKKYGVTRYAKTKEFKNKAKQTNLQRYGVDNYSKTSECKARYKQTCLNKYGVDNYSRTKNFLEKAYSTKKKNNSFNKSSFEENTYELLLTKFNKNDIKRQYKSKLYPFACDFYIKSLDLYIECNGIWTHGKETFDKNNLEHQSILNLWKSKNTKFYRNAIYVWTILDPLKVKTAKENKLNYKVFWNIEEVKNWIKDI